MFDRLSSKKTRSQERQTQTEPYRMQGIMMTVPRISTARRRIQHLGRAGDGKLSKWQKWALYCGALIACLLSMLLWNQLLSTMTPATTIRAGQLLVELASDNNNVHPHNKDAIKIAHVVSLISCQKSSRVKGFLDALIVLRHSIHQNSVHAQQQQHPNSNSKYSYQMYAILHQDGGCVQYESHLARLGYKTLVKATPINVSAATSAYFRSHVEGEKCCGSKEFVKLYAYTLTDHPVAVHWDLDVAVLRPMDDLYDAMIYEANSEQGRAARQRLQVQRPYYQRNLPERIDAFYTRDITSAKPWETVTAVQGGFVVARPSLEHFEMYQKFILETSFAPGRGPGSGWGGRGYGGFQGALAYQGVLAYFYDQVYPGHAVELDVCRWNQVVADVIWRGPEKKEQHLGQCRDHPFLDGDYAKNTPENGRCQDCRALPIEETYTVHYTACKKPWECAIPHPRVPRDKSQVYRLQHLTNVTTCGLLFHRYFEIRTEIEDQIAAKTGRAPSKRDGSFQRDYFMGYCAGPGKYLTMDDIPEAFDMKQVYGF